MTSLRTGAYPLQIAGWGDVVVRAQPTPRNEAERSSYRANLVTILNQHLRVTLAASGDPAPWKRFTLRCPFEVPERLDFAYGWARMAIHLVPGNGRGRTLTPAGIALWHQFVPASVPVLARLSQAVDGSLLAVEWRLPEAPPPRLLAECAAGAVSPAALRPASLSFQIPPAPTPAGDCVEEPAGLIAAQIDSPSRPAPRSLAVSRALTDPHLPTIRFSGRWLSRLGFTPGCRAAVTAEAGRIVLTLAPPTTPATLPSNLAPRRASR